jgi:glucokinase
MGFLLAGDVGGTKTYLRLVKIEADRPETIYGNRYLGKDFGSFEDMVSHFLYEANSAFGSVIKVGAACLGIAGPVIKNTSFLTNLQWTIDASKLETEFDIEQVLLINDFEAIGYGALGLEPIDLYTLQAAESQARAPIAIIGAGTGLGEGFLTWQDDDYQVYPSEGGHVDFAPRSPIEIALLNHLIARYGRISVERVVSGKGIVNIYQFLRDHHAPTESNEILSKVKAWEQGDLTIDPAEEISHAASQQTDRLSMQAIEIFLDAYASEVGNLALKILPYGGLYIAGGIMPKMLSFLASGNFLKNMKLKGRVSPLLDQIPVYVVLNPEVGLIGTVLHGAKLLRNIE